MSMILRPLTYMHLTTARKMPNKQPYLYLGQKNHAKYVRRVKAERKAIARYYWAVRNSTSIHYGRKAASIAHRYGVVTTGIEAKTRLKNMQD